MQIRKIIIILLNLISFSLVAMDNNTAMQDDKGLKRKPDSATQPESHKRSRTDQYNGHLQNLAHQVAQTHTHTHTHTHTPAQTHTHTNTSEQAYTQTHTHTHTHAAHQASNTTHTNAFATTGSESFNAAAVENARIIAFKTRSDEQLLATGGRIFPKDVNNIIVAYAFDKKLITPTLRCLTILKILSPCQVVGNIHRTPDPYTVHSDNPWHMEENFSTFNFLTDVPRAPDNRRTFNRQGFICANGTSRDFTQTAPFYITRNSQYICVEETVCMGDTDLLSLERNMDSYPNEWALRVFDVNKCAETSIIELKGEYDKLCADPHKRHVALAKPRTSAVDASRQARIESYCLKSGALLAAIDLPHNAKITSPLVYVGPQTVAFRYSKTAEDDHQVRIMQWNIKKNCLEPFYDLPEQEFYPYYDQQENTDHIDFAVTEHIHADVLHKNLIVGVKYWPAVKYMSNSPTRRPAKAYLIMNYQNAEPLDIPLIDHGLDIKQAVFAGDNKSIFVSGTKNTLQETKDFIACCPTPQELPKKLPLATCIMLKNLLSKYRAWEQRHYQEQQNYNDNQEVMLPPLTDNERAHIQALPPIMQKGTVIQEFLEATQK